jgi:hypothetical protein
MTRITAGGFGDRIWENVLRTIVLVWIATGSPGCAKPYQIESTTSYALERWNPSGRHDIELQLGSLQMPAPEIRWGVSAPSHETATGTTSITPPLPGCSSMDFYPMHVAGRIERLGRGVYSVHIPGRVDIERLHENFWPRLSDRRCAVFASVSAGTLGRNSVLHLSTQGGEFETVALHPVVRAEWALLLPFTIVADAVIVAAPSLPWVTFYAGLAYLDSRW